MLEEFELLLEKHKEDSKLLKNLELMSQKIQETKKILEQKDRTIEFYKDYDNIIKKLKIKNNKDNVKNELKKIKNKFNYIGYIEENFDYLVSWSYEYTFDNITFSINYSGDNEGSGNIYFKFGDMIRLYEDDKNPVIKLDELYKFYNQLNLKFVSIYYFFKIVLLIANLNCETYQIINISDFFIYEKEIATLKMNYITLNIDKNILDKYSCKIMKPIILFADKDFNIYKKFEDQKIKNIEFRYQLNNSYYYKKDNVVYEMINNKKPSVVEITDKNNKLFEKMFNNFFA